MVDIPGLIEGAHVGAGLGDEFLRHIERTRILVHVIDGNGPDPVEDYFRIRDELRLFDESLAAKPEIVAFNKLDIPGVDDAFELCKDELTGTAVSVRSISAAGRIGLVDLLYDVAEALKSSPARKHRLRKGKSYRLRSDAGSSRGRRACPPARSDRPAPQDS